MCTISMIKPRNRGGKAGDIDSSYTAEGAHLYVCVVGKFINRWNTYAHQKTLA